MFSSFFFCMVLAIAGAGLPPATQAVLLEALHHQKASARAVEKAASQDSSEGGSGGVCRHNRYNVAELLEKVVIFGCPLYNTVQDT